MLPHLRDRPLALQAFPQGIDGKGFFMKSIPRHFPSWIATAEVPKRGGSLTQVIARDAATLVYLVGQNVITPHIWLSRVDRPQLPDRLILDFDPSPGIGFAEVRAAARAAGDRLRDAGLIPYAMVTGSRGVHVVAPLRRGPTFEVVHRFARALAEEMVAADERHLTLEWRRADRGERIYVDVNRINYAQHVVAPVWRAAAGRAHRWRCRSSGTSSRTPACVRIAGRCETPAARLRSDGEPWKGIGRRARGLPASALTPGAGSVDADRRHRPRRRALPPARPGLAAGEGGDLRARRARARGRAGVSR